jgi:phosphotriesterase-related protein
VDDTPQGSDENRLDLKAAAGKVQTVLGLIEADALGITLPHEHLLVDSTFKFSEPDEPADRPLAYAPVTLETLGWVKTHLTNNRDNLQLLDEELAIREAMRFKQAGGGTIVELTNIGIGRNPVALARISRATGLHIVMGSSYYIGASHPPELASCSVNEIAESIVQDLVCGVGDTGVRSGIIGEVGCSSPLKPTEKLVLAASALAQKRTGLAINIHPGGDDRGILEVVDVLDRAGADLRRTIVSHVVKRAYSRETLARLAGAGCFLEIDNFGHDTLNALSFIRAEKRQLINPSDIETIDKVMELIGAGYLPQILISGDCCFKQNLVAYGGHGYAHLLVNIVPWMKAKGVTEEQVSELLVGNPRRVLSVVETRT